MNTSESIDGVTDIGANAAEIGASQMKKFFDDVEDLLRRVTPLGDAELARMRTRVEGSLKTARKVADRQVKQAIDVSSRAAKATDEYVHESPWKAIGIVAVAAVVLGALLTNRHER